MGTARKGGIQDAKLNPDKLFHLPRCKWTGDDTATVFGICVSLLIVLVATVDYIYCVSLLLTLVRCP